MAAAAAAGVASTRAVTRLKELLQSASMGRIVESMIAHAHREAPYLLHNIYLPNNWARNNSVYTAEVKKLRLREAK